MSDFTIERSIAASPSRVWAAFTNADDYAAWIWPPAWTTRCSIDLRIGGVFSLAASEPRLSVEGRYIEIEPISRLVMSWRWGDDPNESLLTISFEPVQDGTRLTLRHGGFADEVTRADHEQGWNDCLDRLPGYLS